MKTKNKILALVEITVVLCSLFLVALPATAADQTMQEVSTSANTITMASEDDYVLGIYGNANEDDTIDMGDVVYTKLAIFGKKPKTELCDAKYDGRINVLDVIQTNLIILGKEKEITIVDGCERIVTVKKPVQRIVCAYRKSLELAQIIKVEKDRIVGVDSAIQGEDWELQILFPEYQDIPTVGGGSFAKPLDCEAILRLDVK
jgi:iron complex transport system substrate-binding protein